MDRDNLELREENGIHIVHMNVRSLGDIKKIDSFKLQFGRSGAHIIGVSETLQQGGISGKPSAD